MVDFFKKNKLILILLVLSLVTRFAFIGEPNVVVFDETFFGSQAHYYFTGEKFFDIHPPLGKLVIALGAKIFGYSKYLSETGGFDFREIGNVYGDSVYFGFRFFPTLFAALIPVVFFLILIQLGFSKKSAFGGGLFLVFENMLLVESRLILLNGQLIFFGLTGFLFYLYFLKGLKAKKTPLLFQFLDKNLKWIVLSSLFIAFSVSVKWTGLMFLAYIFFSLGYQVYRKRLLIKDFLKILLVYLALIVFVYLTSFFIHFKLTPGPQNQDFITRLDLNKTDQMNYFEKLNYYQAEMRSLNVDLEGVWHPYSSKPLEWLNMKKIILYWSSETTDRTAKLVALGNPIIWLLSLIAIVASVLFHKLILLKQEGKWLLFFAYLISYLPFFMISRPMYIYAYLPALIISVAIFFALLEGIITKYNIKRIRLIYGVLFLIVFVFYLIYAPYSYGLWQDKKVDDWKMGLFMRI